jgi:hypothetical protein
VSTVNSSSARSLNRSTSASTSSSDVPRSSRRWIAKPSIAIAADAVPESIARTFPPSSSAATRALWIVPESVSGMWIERIRSYAPSSSYVAAKSPGVGCDVVGVVDATRSFS